MTIEPRCRICFDDIDISDAEQKNSLIAPCDCRGSLAYTHRDCFVTWGKNKCDICGFNFFAQDPPFINNIRGPNIIPVDHNIPHANMMPNIIHNNRLEPMKIAFRHAFNVIKDLGLDDIRNLIEEIYMDQDFISIIQRLDILLQFIQERENDNPQIQYLLNVRVNDQIDTDEIANQIHQLIQNEDFQIYTENIFFNNGPMLDIVYNNLWNDDDINRFHQGVIQDNDNYAKLFNDIAEHDRRERERELEQELELEREQNQRILIFDMLPVEFHGIRLREIVRNIYNDSKWSIITGLIMLHQDMIKIARFNYLVSLIVFSFIFFLGAMTIIPIKLYQLISKSNNYHIFIYQLLIIIIALIRKDIMNLIQA